MNSLLDLKGVGPKLANTLSKLGINTLEDLVCFYPFRYEILKRSEVDSLEQDDKIILDGVVIDYARVFHFKKNKDKMDFQLQSLNHLVKVCIYNRGYLKSRIVPTTKLIVIGKYDKKHNTVVATELRFGLLPSIPIIEPIYHTVSGITSGKLALLVKDALNFKLNIKDYIPIEYSSKYNFLSKEESVLEIHNPTLENSLKKSLVRLKYEEFFLFMLQMQYLKLKSKDSMGLHKEFDFNEVLKFINSLKFKLTKDQMDSINDIYNDFTSIYQMNRLLQGDVGSGKSIVSFVSLFMNYLSGYQGALMAPTEVLAAQHYEEMKSLFKGYNISIALLTGSLKVSERRKILCGIRNHEYDIIVGTHALFSDDVIYDNLGFVITDEQHRFGVKQRSSFKNKGVTPDILYMSATPIPRTYALTIYGDMDVSNIKTMPNGRKEIKTRIYSERDIKEILQSMYSELKLNHQIYVVSPLIEESDNSNLKDIELLAKNMEKAFGSKYSIGMLHGKMNSKDKMSVMNSFSAGDIDILVSTTVIEVGVNVPNSTMMVIFDADRFGLSALHQLRGRVGRGSNQAYCLLISKHKTPRLNILEKTNDGFEISEEDFKLRGSGDLFGIRQSGGMSFKIGDIRKDFSILLKAKADSLTFLNSSLKDKYSDIMNLIVTNHLD